MSDTSQSREPPDAFERLFRDGQTNAVMAWAMVMVLAIVFTESALDADLGWVAFVAVAGVIAVVPPVAYRDWRVMLPWELLALALAPILVRGLLGGQLGTFAYYLSVAGLALLITVELHTFTSLSVTPWFAVAFVVLTTLASAAGWAILRWNLDRTFGTSYLSSNEALMTEFLWVTVAGFAAGLLFESYFKRRDRQLWRAINRVVGR